MKKYIFKPYTPLFIDLFEKEKLQLLLLKDVQMIEHIGSTAIPHLGGKGIIDIGIAAGKSKWESLSKKLLALDYEFRISGCTEDRLFFKKDVCEIDNQVQRYHLHLTYPESQDWINFIKFRNCLRQNPLLMQEYAVLKQNAVKEADGNGEKYRKLKEPLFQKILA
jgi:GrpB-like predicted nucleotidyltransferase (UPF0157 family)